MIRVIIDVNGNPLTFTDEQFPIAIRATSFIRARCFEDRNRNKAQRWAEGIHNELVCSIQRATRHL